ncbi:MAG: hypothetical protein ABI217_11985, partial [Chthoniobacterales bacterium]
ATTRLRRRKRSWNDLRMQASQLLAKDGRSVRENAPLQDRFREGRGRPAVEIVRIEISFRRNRKELPTTEKRYQLDDDVLKLRGRVVCLRGF